MSPRALIALCFVGAAPLAACTTISTYEPAVLEVSMGQETSVLHKASDAYCKEARAKGLASGEASLTSLTDMLTGKASGANAYWKLIGADRGAPSAIVARVRGDLTDTARGLDELVTLARSVLGGGKPTRSDVAEFERALIHARQARDSISDALVEVNKRSDSEYQITLELAPLDEVLGRARSMADELASARARVETASGA